MKIFYLASKITDSGGVSSVLCTRLNYFVEVLGFEVFIFSTNDDTFTPFFSFSSKIKFHFSKVKMTNLLDLVHLKKEINQQILINNPDQIVVVDNGFKSLFYRKMIPNNWPCIYELHATPSYFYGEEYNGFKKYIVQIAIDFLFPSFDKIVTLKPVKASFLNPKKVQVIPNPSTISTTKVSNLNNNKVIAIGRLEAIKNFDQLILIWKEVLKTFPNHKLEIYGEGSQQENLLRLIDTNNLNDSVAIFSPIKNIENALLQADVFVLTSKSESFSLVTLEAMVCGLPVVSFDIGMEHLIENKVTGFVVSSSHDFVKKLIELLESQKLREQFGSAAQQKVKAFALDKVCEQWVLLFNSIKKSL